MYSVNLWNSYFSHYPYVASDVGIFSKTSTKSYALNFYGHYFYESSQLQGFNVGSRISPLPFLSFDLNYTDLTEKLGTQEDYLQFYNVLINYSRVRKQRWALWWGLGLKGMKGTNTHLGPAFNVGTQIYPVKPMSLHLNFNIASLNEQSVSELLVHLNFHINRVFFYVGYQRFSAGSAVIDGGVAGVGFHL